MSIQPPDMSVIIRLQNLPWSANSLDIRQYFQGLSIPEGGVHIVGGEMGDAFIAFSTDEDARQAMMLGGGKIKEVKISLMLSSRTEMQKVIEAARQASMSTSLAHLMAPQQQQQQQHHQVLTQQIQVAVPAAPSVPSDPHPLPNRDVREDKKESSDVSSGNSHDGGRDRRERKDRSKSRERGRGDRRDRKRYSRSRSRSRERRRRRSRSRSRDRKTRDNNKNSRRDEPRKDRERDRERDREEKPGVQSRSGQPNPVQNPNQDPNQNPNPSQNSNPNVTSPWQGGGAPRPPLLGASPAINNFPAFGLLGNFRGQINTETLNQVSQGLLQNIQNLTRNSQLDKFTPRQHDNSRGAPNERQGLQDNDIRNMNFNDSDSRNLNMNMNNFNMLAGNNSNNMRDGDDRGGSFNRASNFNRGNFNPGDNFNSGDNFNRGNVNQMQPGPMRGDLNFGPNFGNSFPNNNFLGQNAGGFPGRNSDPMRNNRFQLKDEQGRRGGSPGRNSSQHDRRGNSGGSRWSDSQMDEFGRNVNSPEDRFRDKKSDEDCKQVRNQPNFPGFSTRFMANHTTSQDSRSRDSWPPNSNERGSRFSPDQHDLRFRSSGRREERHQRREVKSEKPEKPEDGNCIELVGLDRDTSYSDVRRTFNALRMGVLDIKFHFADDGKRAMIQCLDHDSKKKALHFSTKLQINRRVCKVLHVNDKEFENLISETREPKFSDEEDEKEKKESKEQEKKKADKEKEMNVEEAEGFVLMKNLPHSFKESDVQQLFPNAKVLKVVLVSSGNGQRGYVKFNKNSDAKSALLSRTSLGDVKFPVLTCTQTEFDKVCKSSSKEAAVEDEEPVQVISGSVEQAQVMSDGRQVPLLPNIISDCIIIKNLPLQANDRDICDFFSDVGLVPTRVHIMLDIGGQPSGDAFCEFPMPQQAVNACVKNGNPMGKNNLMVSLVPRPEMLVALGIVSGPAGSGYPGGPGPMGFMGPAPRPEPLMNFGNNRCVVAMENIPFRAGTQDIVKFFDWNFQLAEKDVLRRFNERGMATGDARVSLASHEEAIRAVRTLNGKRIMARPVRLYLL